MSLINLKFNPNYNNIRKPSGERAALYFSDTLHMKLQIEKKRNSHDKMLSVTLDFCS